MNQKKIVIICIILLALIIGGSVYWYNKKEQDRPQDSSNQDNGNITIDGGNTDSPLAGDLPSLDRPLVVTDSTFPKASQEIAMQKMPQLIEALKKNANDLDTWIELASYRKLIGDYKGAEEIYLYWVVLRPNDVIIANNLAYLYSQNLKNYPEAEKYFQIVLRLDPKNPLRYESVYQFYRYTYTAKADTAVNTLLDGLKELPERIELMVMIARHYKETGDKDKAHIYYTQAIQAAKNLGDIKIQQAIEAEAV